MKKAKIYIPTKTAMQSGRGKHKKWVLEFDTKDIKAEEYYSFISLSDRYVFNRKSFAWYAETEEDGENIANYESNGSCRFIDKSEFKSLVKV